MHAKIDAARTNSITDRIDICRCLGYDGALVAASMLDWKHRSHAREPGAFAGSVSTGQMGSYRQFLMRIYNSRDRATA